MEWKVGISHLKNYSLQNLTNWSNKAFIYRILYRALKDGEIKEDVEKMTVSIL
jgi:hypothetical protein